MIPDFWKTQIRKVINSHTGESQSPKWLNSSWSDLQMKGLKHWKTIIPASISRWKVSNLERWSFLLRSQWTVLKLWNTSLFEKIASKKVKLSKAAIYELTAGEKVLKHINAWIERRRKSSDIDKLRVRQWQGCWTEATWRNCDMFQITSVACLKLLSLRVNSVLGQSFSALNAAQDKGLATFYYNVSCIILMEAAAGAREITPALPKNCGTKIYPLYLFQGCISFPLSLWCLSKDAFLHQDGGQFGVMASCSSTRSAVPPYSFGRYSASISFVRVSNCFFLSTNVICTTGEQHHWASTEHSDPLPESPNPSQKVTGSSKWAIVWELTLFRVSSFNKGLTTFQIPLKMSGEFNMKTLSSHRG